MKKLALFAWFLAIGSAVFAQSLDDINDMLGKKNYLAAKAGIDKFLEDPKKAAKPDGWYFKGRVYNALSYDSSITTDTSYNLKIQANEAFLRYQSLDTKELRLKLENYASFLDLYFGFYDLGIKMFNARNYEASFQSFKRAIEQKDFLLNRKYDYGQTKLYPLDTALVVNTATAAAQAKNDLDAVKYFRLITDAGIYGDDFQSVYEYLADYYSKNGPEEELNSILKKARKYYPKDDFWDQIELGGAEKKGDSKSLRAKYEERIAADPSNYTLSYDYAVYLYNLIYTGDEKQPDEAELKTKLGSVLQNAIKNDKGIDATFLMANHLYNIASDYSSAAAAIRSTKPEDVKKKKELSAQTNKYMDEFTIYGDNYLNYLDGLPTLSASQKANYRSIAASMMDVFNLKGNAAKEQEYKARKDNPKHN